LDSARGRNLLQVQKCLEEDLSTIQELTVDEYLQALLPRALPESLDDEDNAIKQRVLIVYGRQESGKSNTARVIIQGIKDLYGYKTVTARTVPAEDFRSILDSKWSARPVQVIALEDITDVELTEADARDFFRIRHIMADRTGRLDGLCVVIFTLHRFHDMPKSFRSDYDSLIVHSVPMNDYDYQFIENKITRAGVKMLEAAEIREEHGLAIVSVRRHLLATVQFPRYIRRRRSLRGFLERFKFW
jgi:hypothetical protein